jgi:hypothetical protein
LRTWNPDEADVFYIPAYFALLFLCNENETEPMMKETSTLRKLLSESSYFARGKLHISTLSFLYLWMRPDLFLTNTIIRRITFITLESLQVRKRFVFSLLWIITSKLNWLLFRIESPPFSPVLNISNPIPLSLKSVHIKGWWNGIRDVKNWWKWRDDVNLTEERSLLIGWCQSNRKA